jgi:drug/metabolite transporter (DMT)-like permease
MTPSRFNLSPEWGLVMVTALWGSSFILLSLSLKGLSPGLLVALRFGSDNKKFVIADSVAVTDFAAIDKRKRLNGRRNNFSHVFS